MANSASLRRGLWFGTGFAVCYSLIGILVYMARGETAYSTNHTSLGKILLAYWLCGLVAGLLVGGLSRFADSWLGAALVGSLVGIVVLWGLGMSVSPPRSWFGETLTNAVILGTVMGGAAGLYIRKKGPL